MPAGLFVFVSAVHARIKGSPSEWHRRLAPAV